MKTFGEKVKDARSELNITQTELANMVGVSMRSIIAYEKNEKMPRQGTLLKLSKALKVSVTFLKDENCDDPMCDYDKDGYIEQARMRYGQKSADELEQIMNDTSALFAGGELSQEQKDAFFDAILTAYVMSKQKASEKFGPKD